MRLARRFRSSNLRGYKANGGKVVDLIAYYKKKHEIEHKEEMTIQYNAQARYKRKGYEYALLGAVVNTLMKEKIMLGNPASNIIGFWQATIDK